MEQEVQNEPELSAEEKRQRTLKEVRSWILTLGIPVIVVLLLNIFICRFAFVVGSSMYPTLHNKDVMLVRKIAYSPKNSDIIVVDVRDNDSIEEDHIVKRVIAIEGQTVDIDYGLNAVYVDGVQLDEPYINMSGDDPMIDRTGTGYQSFTVPEGCVFVMGDNRNNSLDSRSGSVGMIPEGSIMGGVLFTIPVGKLFE